jgi:hypothetical protein
MQDSGAPQAGGDGDGPQAVPDSAPELRAVTDGPAGEALRTYETQLGADELLKQFLADISDVAREAEVLRCARRTGSLALEPAAAAALA